MRNDRDAVSRIVSRLMNDGSEAGRFVSINVVETFAIVDPSFAREALALVERQMLPPMLEERGGLPHLLVCAAGIVETNIEANWEYLIPSLDAAFAYLDEVDDDDERLAFAKELRCITMSVEGRSGIRLVEYLFGAGYFGDDSAWRPAALEICAGMLVGHRVELKSLFSRLNIPESTLRVVEALRTQEVLDQHRTFGARDRWNYFFVCAIAENAKLRYLMLKHMLCPISFCNDVSEWATQMGTFMIEAIRVYSSTDQDESQFAQLSVKDIRETTPMHPVEGAGKRYIPRRKTAPAQGSA
jgi:hypothetical protein